MSGTGKSRRPEAFFKLCLMAALLPLAAHPDVATAQVAGSVTVASDYRLRGLSLNGGGLVVTGGIAYDDESGVYLGGSVTGGQTDRFGPQILSHIEYVGYARRFESDVTLDVGLSNTQVFSNVLRRFSGSYTEVYAGVSSDAVSAHIYLSPSFIAPGLRTAYVDLNATLRPARRVRVLGHIGVLIPLAGNGATVAPQSRDDLRFGVVLELARSEIQLAWTRSGAADRFLADRRQPRNAIVVGASWFF